MRALTSIGIVAASALLLLVSTPGPAQAGTGAFEQLAGQAEEVDSLAAFLESFVGECRNSPEKRTCLENARAERSGLSGRLFKVRLRDRHSRLLRVDREHGDGRVGLVLTPMFDAAGYGLTRGKPLGLDAAGNPRLRLVSFDVSLPEGMNRRRLELAMRTGNLRMELLFVPENTWRLSGRAQGVAARFKGLRLTSARTGRVVGEVVW